MNSKILWISCFEKIGDKKNFKNYILNAKAALIKFNVKIKFASSEITKLEGKKFERIVCLEFKNISDAKKFFKSKDYKFARKFLSKGKSIRYLNLIRI